MPNDLEQFAGGELKVWSLQPDAAVWDAVAERIRKERRRRIIFWWTSAAALLLMIAGTWVFFQDDSKTEFAKLNPIKTQTEQATEKTNQSKRDLTESQANNFADTSAVSPQQIVTQSEQHKHQQSLFIKAQKGFLVKKRKKNQPQSNQADSKLMTVLQNEQADLLPSDIVQKETMVVVQENEIKNDDTAQTLMNAKEDAILTQGVVSNKTDTLSTSAIDSAKQKNTRKQPSWYFNAQAGFSDIKPSELFSMAVAQDMQFNGGNSPVIGAGNLSGTVFVPGDLQYRAGFSFSLGAGITLLQNKHWQFSTGLQYRYASMQLATGARVDTVFQARESRTNAATAVTAFYRPGNGYTYQHQFHLLQLPMVFHLQPLGLKKWRLDAGILPGVLLGAKALHYNEGNNIFYASNQQYQRLLLNASIGIQYAIPIQKGKKLWVGPQLELGLRNMHQSALSRKAFFQSANLTFTIQ